MEEEDAVDVGVTEGTTGGDKDDEDKVDEGADSEGAEIGEEELEEGGTGSRI